MCLCQCRTAVCGRGERAEDDCQWHPASLPACVSQSVPGHAFPSRFPRRPLHTTTRCTAHLERGEKINGRLFKVRKGVARPALRGELVVLKHEANVVILNELGCGRCGRKPGGGEPKAQGQRAVRPSHCPPRMVIDARPLLGSCFPNLHILPCRASAQRGSSNRRARRCG